MIVAKTSAYKPHPAVTQPSAPGKDMPCLAWTVEMYRAMGYWVITTELRGKYGRTHDFGGFADLICCHHKHGILAVQATDHTHYSTHLAKILSNKNAIAWLAAGGTIQLVAWKDGKPPRVRVETLR